VHCQALLAGFSTKTSGLAVSASPLVFVVAAQLPKESVHQLNKENVPRLVPKSIIE
jgi:hypothetical protein